LKSEWSFAGWPIRSIWNVKNIVWSVIFSSEFAVKSIVSSMINCSSS
jgi:hypothetical protein